MGNISCHEAIVHRSLDEHANHEIRLTWALNAVLKMRWPKEVQASFVLSCITHVRFVLVTYTGTLHEGCSGSRMYAAQIVAAADKNGNHLQASHVGTAPQALHF